MFIIKVASCDCQKCKLCAVAGAEGLWVAELRVRQLKIGRKSCFEFITLKKSHQDLSNEGSKKILSSLELGF